MGYKIVPHTGDVRIRVEGKTLTELFESALQGMFTLMQPVYRKGQIKRGVSVEAPDREALLVTFLEELLYLSDTKNETYQKVTFKKLEERHLSGEVIGRPVERLGLEIKAVTWQSLEIKEQAGRLFAEIVFDI